MKKTLTLAAAVAISTAALTANATDMYVKAGMGASSTKLKVDAKSEKKSAPTVMLGLGATVAPDTRVEATLDYTQYTKNALKVKAMKLMLNAEYDIVEVTPGVKMYGAAGVGIAKMGSKSPINKKKFAFSVGAGVNGKLADTIGWDLGYKFTHVAKIKKAGVTVKPSQHTVMASVKFHM